jgi:hypothetical protein
VKSLRPGAISLSRLLEVADPPQPAGNDPAGIDRGEVALARAAGLSDAALADALFVGFVFNTVNRLANAFDCGWETESDRIKLARSLDRIGYHVPGFLLG